MNTAISPPKGRFCPPCLRGRCAVPTCFQTRSICVLGQALKQCRSDSNCGNPITFGCTLGNRTVAWANTPGLFCHDDCCHNFVVLHPVRLSDNCSFMKPYSRRRTTLVTFKLAYYRSTTCCMRGSIARGNNPHIMMQSVFEAPFFLPSCFPLLAFPTLGRVTGRA